LFKTNEPLVDWLRQYSKDPDETYVRGFLGRMLFSGEESLKQVNVLSGGEKVRLQLCKIFKRISKLHRYPVYYTGARLYCQACLGT